MFGYLKPYNNELKGKHVSEYKSQYCTLCYGLRTNLGLLSVLLLNYECTFLFLFLSSITDDESQENYAFRCPVNPTKKCSTKASSEILEYASFINYHLAVLKANDGCVDSHGVKRLGYKILYWLLSKNKKYSKLRAKYLTVAEKTEQLCKDLYAFEKNGELDFDLCSGTMGGVLVEIVNGYMMHHSIELQQPVVAFANHLGMWTYLIDAYDDFEKDSKKGSFNPLISFSNDSDTDKANEARLHSGELMLGMMTSNLRVLLKKITLFRYNEIIENIISFGTLTAVQVCKKKKVKKNDCNCKK